MDDVELVNSGGYRQKGVNIRDVREQRERERTLNSPSYGIVRYQTNFTWNPLEAKENRFYAKRLLD